ncbi:unnamed protein product [Caenorhabditis sp. 36 PRJEB53466]|nr:unnamed protein product [Caenorhabditis sp. 36 PRJEB53466]
MVHYKLTYFDARGLGEAARQLFVLAGVPFEDNRLSIEQFKVLKPTLPAGHVPVLLVDGFEISQSQTINRYLARKFGLAGKTPEEEATADTVVDLFKDFLPSFKEMSSGIFFGKTPEELVKIKKEITGPAMEIYFGDLKKILNKNKSGYFVGNGLTWADIVVAENMYTLFIHGLFDLDKEKELAEFYKRVRNTPKLKEYLEKRPYSVV